jgi:LPS-assembly lipoprotein
MLLAIILALLVSACGFRLQGQTPLPFTSLRVAIPENTQFGADVRRAIQAASPNTRLVENNEGDYQAALQQVSESRTAREVSLNAQGRVEEYELTLTYTFRIVSNQNQIILPDTTLIVQRNLPFDDRVVQAKEGEQATLFQQMQMSLVSRLMRRISAPDVAEQFKRLQAQGPSQ